MTDFRPAPAGGREQGMGRGMASSRPAKFFRKTSIDTVFRADCAASDWTEARTFFTRWSSSAARASRSSSSAFLAEMSRHDADHPAQRSR